MARSERKVGTVTYFTTFYCPPEDGRWLYRKGSSFSRIEACSDLRMCNYPVGMIFESNGNYFIVEPDGEHDCLMQCNCNGAVFASGIKMIPRQSSISTIEY